MQEWLILGVASLLGISIFIAIIYFYYRKSNPKKTKRKDRNNKSSRVVGAAKSFARSNGYKCISPATLVRNGAVANLDAVIVGYFGVLGVKALGYNGTIYGSAGDDEWLQVTDEEERHYFKNPLNEAIADVRVIRDALFQVKLKQVQVEVVCVFADPDVQLALPKNTGHYTFKDYKSLLGKDKYLADAGIDIEKIEQVLRESVEQN